MDCLAHNIPNMLPLEPPVVNVPNPSAKPIISDILFMIVCSIKVARGASSYVYID